MLYESALSLVKQKNSFCKGILFMQDLEKLMGNRPKLKIELTIIDKISEALGWLLLFAFWFLIITNYPKIPDIVPTHFNFNGKADAFGGKARIFTLPSIATILFLGMTILNKFPHIFNYPTEITNDNALRQYKSATRMIRFLKLIIVLIFGLIAYQVGRY